MTESEKEVLERTVKELEATKEIQKQGEILDKIISQLPDGEIKSFFQEVDQMLAPLEEITKKEECERKELDEVLEAVRAVKGKLEGGESPEGIPEKIIETYKKFLDFIIFGFETLKGLKGFVDLF